MTFHVISIIINALTSVSLSIFVLVKNPRDIRHVVFFLLGVSASVWSCCALMLAFSRDPSSAYFWSRSLMIGVIFIPVFYLHFVMLLTEDTEPNKWALTAFYLLSFFFIAVNSGKGLVRGVSERIWFTYWPDAGSLLIVFLAFMGVYLAYISFLLFRSYLSASGIRKVQLRFVIIATLVGWLGGASNFPLWYGLELYPAGNILISLVVGLNAWAIIKYRFLDIEIIAKRGTVYFLITALMTALYVLMMMIADVATKSSQGPETSWVLLPVVLLLSVTYYPLSRTLQAWMDRTVLLGMYVREKAAEKFSQGISTIMNPRDMCAYLTQVMFRVFKSRGCAVYLYNKDSGTYDCMDATGSHEQHRGASVSSSHELVDYLGSSGEALSEDDIFFLLKHEEMQNLKPVLEMINFVEKNKISLMVPLMSSSKKSMMLGFIALDSKKSNEAFFSDELLLLKSLSGQASDALENIILYEEHLKSISHSLQLEKLAALGSAAAGVAHEIKNKLGYVMNFAELLPYVAENEKFMNDAAKIFPKEVEQIKLILNGILDYSQPAQPKPEKLHIKRLVNDTIVLIRDRAKVSNVKVEDLAEDNITAYADRNCLKQTFLNLFLNAMDAMPSGGTLRITAGTSGDRVLIEISDTGTGIDNEIIKKIFDPFFTTKPQGTGLGLSIVKKMIVENNGTISVESTPGKGTRFTIELKG